MGGGLNLHPWNAFASSLPWRLILDTRAWSSEGYQCCCGILPEALRRDIVGARNVFTVSILYRLFVVYQPRGKGLPKSRTSKQDARGKMNPQNTMAQGDMNLCQILE